MKKPTILLFGDSHSHAIQRALERRKARGRPAPLSAHRLRKTKGKKQIGDTSFEEFLAMVQPLGENDIVLSMIGGNQHAVFSTIQHPRHFDFFEPGSVSGIEKGAEAVPYRMLLDFFSSGIHNNDGKSLKALKNSTQARVVHVIPPPPKGDNAFINQHHESLFVDRGIETHGTSSPSLRMKFWRLQTLVLRRLCAKINVEVILPPSKATDADGFLAPDYYANDATHANAAYGELILRQIERRFLSSAALANSA